MPSPTPQDAHRLLLERLSALSPAYLGTFAAASDLRAQAEYVDKLAKIVAEHFDFIEADARLSAGIRKVNAAYFLLDAGADLSGAIERAADEMTGVAA